MIFSSYGFIFVFLPVILAGYFILRLLKDVRPLKVWLLAASLYFYAQGNPVYFPLLAGTVVFNFAAVRLLKKSRQKPVLQKMIVSAAAAENLGLLFYFKYMNFFLGNVNLVLGTDYIQRNIILPLGISFYTFQILSYIIDYYKGEAGESSFLDFALFVSFFPQLIVGPIMRHDSLVEQFNLPGFRWINTDNISRGILLFSAGCAKKILIANPLITHAQYFYNTMGNGNFFEAWGAVFSYTFAYYFDFSGYIDMALGLGLFFNISLPANFNSPYKARNFADFWHRWNITVSNFFYDYIFKAIFRFGDGLIKLITAVMITFIVSGLWHGASWHYVFWGIANGILVCFANIMTLKRKKLPLFVAWPLTFFFVLVTRVLFDANGLTQAFHVYKTMFGIAPAFAGFRAFAAMGGKYISANPLIIALILAGAFICFFMPNIMEMLSEKRPQWYHAALGGVFITTSLFFMGTVSSFLYFQF